MATSGVWVFFSQSFRHLAVTPSFARTALKWMGHFAYVIARSGSDVAISFLVDFSLVKMTGKNLANHPPSPVCYLVVFSDDS